VSFPKQKKPRSWRVLQEWIRHYADQEELPQSRVRRAVSFMLVALPLDRSLDEEGDPLFLVKGGVSMELRLKLRARTTKDLDTVYRGTFEHWLGSLDEALAEDIDDFSTPATSRFGFVGRITSASTSPSTSRANAGAKFSSRSRRWRLRMSST